MKSQNFSDELIQIEDNDGEEEERSMMIGSSDEEDDEDGATDDRAVEINANSTSTSTSKRKNPKTKQSEDDERHSVTDATISPLDQAQNLTWESMYRTQHYATKYASSQRNPNLFQNLKVQIYCAKLWMDVDTIQSLDPPLCTPNNTFILNRSTSTEYPWLQPRIHYPFVQHMLDPLVALHTEYDYLIMTNSDIALVEPFYVLATHAILKYEYDVFTVNRRTISKGYYNQKKTSKSSQTIMKSNIDNDVNQDYKPTYSSSKDNNDDSRDKDNKDGEDEDITVINAMQQPEYHVWTHHNISMIESPVLTDYVNHPGTDNYFIKSEMMPKFTLGNLCLGHPPWARVLKRTMEYHIAMNYRIFQSKFGWTYHLGNDQDWKNQSRGKRSETGATISFVNNKNNYKNMTVSQIVQKYREQNPSRPQGIPGFPHQMQMRVMKGCVFRNDNVPNPTGHFFQNTQNCANLCAGYYHAVHRISLQVQNLSDANDLWHMINSRQQKQNDSEPTLPRFALDPIQFEKVTLKRLQEEHEKKIAKKNARNNSTIDGKWTANVATTTLTQAMTRIQNPTTKKSRLGTGNPSAMGSKKVAREKLELLNDNNYGGVGGSKELRPRDDAMKQLQQRKQELYQKHAYDDK